MGSWALRQAETAERGPAVGREGGSGVEGGQGESGADQHRDFYHYLLTGQTDKWKNRHTDKQTARERSRTQGSLFYFTTGNVTDTIKMGGGRGSFPCRLRGTGEERRAPVLSGQRRWPEWQSRGRGWVGSEAPSPLRLSEVSFLSNEGSGRPGRPHWGVRFLFCTRYLSWWGRPRGGCRGGLFSETTERRRKGTKGWGWRAGTERESNENPTRALRQVGRARRGRRAADTHAGGHVIAARSLRAGPAGERRHSDRGGSLWQGEGLEGQHDLGRAPRDGAGRTRSHWWGVVCAAGWESCAGALVPQLHLQSVSDTDTLAYEPTVHAVHTTDTDHNSNTRRRRHTQEVRRTTHVAMGNQRGGKDTHTCSPAARSHMVLPGPLLPGPRAHRHTHTHTGHQHRDTHSVGRVYATAAYSQASLWSSVGRCARVEVGIQERCVGAKDTQNSRDVVERLAGIQAARRDL